MVPLPLTVPATGSGLHYSEKRCSKQAVVARARLKGVHLDTAAGVRAQDGSRSVPAERSSAFVTAQIFNPCHYPHLRGGFLRDTNANRGPPQIPATARDGLKPRRGGLFIANEHPEIILFVFRRRGFC